MAPHGPFQAQKKYYDLFSHIEDHKNLLDIFLDKDDINKIEEVGNYAIRIIFSDEHSSGIFSWDLLYDFGKTKKNI